MKITAFVSEGSLVSIIQPQVVSHALDRDLDWEEFENPEDEDPNKTYYQAEVSEKEFKIATKALDDFMNDLGRLTHLR